MAKPNPEIAITVPEAGREIGLSEPAAYAAAARGEIPTRRFGRRLIVPIALWRRKLNGDEAA